DSAAGDAASFAAAADAGAAGAAALVVAGADAVAAGDSGGVLFPPQDTDVNKPRHAEKSVSPFMRTNVSSRTTQMARPSGRQRPARRIPVTCQRASGGKKFRYVGRVCAAGVKQEAPRRTIWFTMNFPLYSPTAPAAVLKRGYGE